ncbi:hypothetical protein [Pseudomonas sp. P129]|uniref:hypothetical protein n=1 Tax=Pseudomonas sp. P129 TaxID=2823887 RepID=UPI001CE246BF|nr:hypothetical protein [Pseudomonas sp. P129]MCA5965843.1 hypothetical protein [Pseudomonas sp. P129]
MNTSALLPVDMVLYTPNEVEFKGDIADSTKGDFFHVSLILTNSSSLVYETLHTGEDGAYIKNENFSFGVVPDGVFIVRAKIKVSVRLSMRRRKNWPAHLMVVQACLMLVLAAWDRKCLQNKSFIFRLFSQKISKRIISFFNQKGALNICSGLTLDVLSKSMLGGQKLFKESPVVLSQMSPNCIYFEAVLDRGDV